jgi:hypothetical protein
MKSAGGQAPNPGYMMAVAFHGGARAILLVEGLGLTTLVDDAAFKERWRLARTSSLSFSKERLGCLEQRICRQPSAS